MTVANSRSEPSICISKNKSHCHCIIVWHREILLTIVPLVSYEFKEAPAAAVEAPSFSRMTSTNQKLFLDHVKIFSVYVEKIIFHNSSPTLYPLCRMLKKVCEQNGHLGFMIKEALQAYLRGSWCGH